MPSQDEETYQRDIGKALLTLSVLRSIRPIGDPERMDAERMIAHCEWRRDNQDYPHPTREERK